MSSLSKSYSQPVLAGKRNPPSNIQKYQERGLVQYQDSIDHSASTATLPVANRRRRKNKNNKTRFIDWSAPDIITEMESFGTRKKGNRPDRSNFLLSCRNKAGHVAKRILEPWTGLSSMYVNNQAYKNDSRPQNRKWVNGDFNRARRFPPATYAEAPGPKYNRDDNERPPGNRYTFGGGAALRDQFVFSVVKNGLIYPSKPATNETGVGPARYQAGDAMLKFKHKQGSRVMWSRDKSKRFESKSRFEMIPGPKYDPVLAQRTNGVNWGPKKRREELQRMKEATTYQSRSTTDLFMEENRRNKKNIEKAGSEGGEELDDDEIRRAKRRERKRNQNKNLPWNRSTWAKRMPSGQFTGKKFAKQSKGHASPGPIYSPMCENWQLKYKASAMLPERRSRAWK
jgi:hypothetical protein